MCVCGGECTTIYHFTITLSSLSSSFQFFPIAAKLVECGVVLASAHLSEQNKIPFQKHCVQHLRSLWPTAMCRGYLGDTGLEERELLLLWRGEQCWRGRWY